MYNRMRRQNCAALTAEFMSTIHRMIENRIGNWNAYIWATYHDREGYCILDINDDEVVGSEQFVEKFSIKRTS